jgi:phytoene dehydrogenase-like protein
MAKEAERRGVAIRTGARVTRVLVEGGRAAGVVLEDGSEYRARCIAANVTPPRLFLDLVGEEHLDPDFAGRIRSFRCASGTFRMNVALSSLPRFTAAPPGEGDIYLRSGIIIAPSLRYMEQAYFDARMHGWARAPVVEMLVPSTIDDTLAPPGCHVASLFCQHFNPELPDGRSWDEVKEAVADLILDTVEQAAPGFRASVVGRVALSPLDLERRFGLTGGDIFHGAITPDQLYSARPVLGHADYRAPVRGLYLCGSGAHPGGGVSGIPGHNAAREILADLKSRAV